MNGGPPLSVVIPWADRPEIGITLRRNAPLFAAAGAEVVVVNCGGDPDRLAEALAGVPLPGLRRVEVPASGFNKGLALNLGVSAARSGRLFLLDADVVLQEDLLPRGIGLLDRPCFVTIDRVLESQPPRQINRPGLREVAHVVELVGPRNRKVRLETNRVRFRDASRSGPGLILLTREHFLAVDGMNSDLEGWGWEDLDLLARLQLALRLPRRRWGSVVHLSHGDDVRRFDGPAPAANEQRNYAMCLINYGLGHYRGTCGDDVATWGDRIVLHAAGEGE
jgi:glycosyltransferase involved in cell wall biosynthesis